MISCAARNSWVFDFLFWRFLDARYFGHNEDQDRHARLKLLKDQEREGMELFVKAKTEEQSERMLVQWDRDSAAEPI